MKRKSDYTTIFDELRSQDSKRRLSSVSMLRDLATYLGPAKTKNDLVPFLMEYLQDEKHIVLALLQQLHKFTDLMGGVEHCKNLLPVFLGLCETDEKEVGLKAAQELAILCSSNKELTMECIKKLAKSDMKVSKECMCYIITSVLHSVPTIEGSLIETYTSLFHSDNPAYKIIAAKYVNKLLKSAVNKDQVGKILDLIYSDSEELVKIYALPALMAYLEINPTSSNSKIKNLGALNSWRISTKLLEELVVVNPKIKKSDFNMYLEPLILKSLASEESQLRMAAIKSLHILVPHQDDVQGKLVPLLKKLSTDSVDFVKVAFSEKITQLLKYLPANISKQYVIPLIYNIVKNSQVEYTISLINNFPILAEHINSAQLDEKIIKPIINKLSDEKWRYRCKALTIFTQSAQSPIFQKQHFIAKIIELANDRIDAVRKEAVLFLAALIPRQDQQWVSGTLLPKLSALSQHKHYLVRQTMLELIQKTSDAAPQNILKEVYRPTVCDMLSDKVPNVRAKAVVLCKQNKNIMDSKVKKKIETMKDDKDTQVRDVLKTLR